MNIYGWTLEQVTDHFDRVDISGKATVKFLGESADNPDTPYKGYRIGYEVEEYSQRKWSNVIKKEAAWLIFRDGKVVSIKTTLRAVKGFLGIAKPKPATVIRDQTARDHDTDVRLEIRELNDKGYCFPRAVANAADISYKEAREICIKEAGYKPKGGGTPTRQIKPLLKNRFNAVDYTEAVREKAKTVNTFNKLNISGRWIILVRGHALASVNGEITDWTAGRNHRIEAAYKIS